MSNEVSSTGCISPNASSNCTLFLPMIVRAQSSGDDEEQWPLWSDKDLETEKWTVTQSRVLLLLLFFMREKKKACNYIISVVL